MASGENKFAIVSLKVQPVSSADNAQRLLPFVAAEVTRRKLKRRETETTRSLLTSAAALTRRLERVFRMGKSGLWRQAERDAALETPVDDWQKCCRRYRSASAAQYLPPDAALVFQPKLVLNARCRSVSRRGFCGNGHTPIATGTSSLLKKLWLNRKRE